MSTETPSQVIDAASLPVFPGVALGDAFARALPELGLPWEAASPSEPTIAALNEPLARELGLDPARLREEAGVRFLLGNALAKGSRPVAQVYAGHQFGGYSPRLGDGRALLLGEIARPDGDVVDLHLKGSGPTPFSRGGDGFAAVGPMLREYALGEFMHAAGIPTTRALAVVATGRRVPRGDVLPGAVLVRVASSHLRVGSFQYARSTGDLGLLRRLADHAIARHYPSLTGVESPYLGLLAAVIGAQARLTAAWMNVGFVHGVMNTDNVTISGETIDYGPCAFIEGYDPGSVFSSIDERGRYAYGNQPEITLWNLTRFAEALLPLLADGVEEAKEFAISALEAFQPDYDAAWAAGMRAKLGLVASAVGDDAVGALAGEILGELESHRIDFTRFFRALGDAALGRESGLRELFPDPDALGAWFDTWLRLDPDGDEMDRVNPVYIPRNQLLEEALDAANEGDLVPFEQLIEVLAEPFGERPGLERYASPAPAGSRRFVTTCGT